jgi:hypothetical protein
MKSYETRRKILKYTFLETITASLMKIFRHWPEDRRNTENLSRQPVHTRIERYCSTLSHAGYYSAPIGKGLRRKSLTFGNA